MEDLAGTAGALLTRWGWVLGLVVLFALVYRFGTGRGAGAPAPAGYGCLVSVVVTLLFFLVVVF
ncbi:MAG TPA: hypothetical protein VFX53_10655 [Pedococcus sp.]|jgi:hypothetical protein|nr:hypothetical protein [Pedococcus sp.]